MLRVERVHINPNWIYWNKEMVVFVYIAWHEKYEPNNTITTGAASSRSTSNTYITWGMLILSRLG